MVVRYYSSAEEAPPTYSKFQFDLDDRQMPGKTSDIGGL